MPSKVFNLRQPRGGSGCSTLGISFGVFSNGNMNDVKLRFKHSRVYVNCHFYANVLLVLGKCAIFILTVSETL